jgi:hypothetical protein
MTKTREELRAGAICRVRERLPEILRPLFDAHLAEMAHAAHQKERKRRQ